MVDFRIFLNHFEQIANPKGELTSKLCFTAHYHVITPKDHLDISRVVKVKKKHVLGHFKEYLILSTDT